MTNISLDAYPLTKWICADPDALWHLGKRHESRGSRTGTLLSVYYKTACSGRQLGGPWGQTERTELPPNAGVCPRCAALAKKQQAPSPAEPVPVVEKPYDPTKSTDPYEALVLEHKCGSTKMGEEVVLAEGGQAFARMIHDTPESRTLALKIVTQLNDSIERGSRPSRQQVRAIGKRFEEERERNRQHIRKTMELNMRLTDEHWGLVRHCVDTNQPGAIRWAAECYAVRSFVLGVIEGRGYALDQKELDGLKREWEEMWDKAFGDLVGATLKMQE